MRKIYELIGKDCSVICRTEMIEMRKLYIKSVNINKN